MRETVICTVQTFDNDTLTGTATTPQGYTVKFAAINCRKTKGTLLAPEITWDPADCQPKIFVQKHPQIVMLLEVGKRSARAITWGNLPEFDWAAELEDSGLLAKFIGGTVTVRIKRRRAQVITGRFSGFDLSIRTLILQLSVPGGRGSTVTRYALSLVGAMPVHSRDIHRFAIHGMHEGWNVELTFSAR
jgi:hypothetical protein